MAQCPGECPGVSNSSLLAAETAEDLLQYPYVTSLVNNNINSAKVFGLLGI